MSVNTTADDHKEAAINDLRSALEHLTAIVVGHCDGWDDFNDVGKSRLHVAFTKSMEARNTLEKR